MSRHRVTIVFDVDDEQLADHLSAQRENKTVPPYSENVADWDASDLVAANEVSIIDFYEASVVAHMVEDA